MSEDFSNSYSIVSPAVLGLLTHLWLNSFEPVAPTTALGVIASVPAANLLALQYYAAPGPSAARIVACYATYLLSLLTSVVAYRLSPLHPLWRFPGPAVAKLTDFWGAWLCWNGCQHTETRKLHDIYGPIFRTGPNKLSITDVDIVSSVLSATGLPKGQSYETRQDPNAPKNLFVLKGQEHTARRPLWNRGMSSDAFKEYEIFLRARATQLVERLKTESRQGSVDISAWLGYFSLDFMGDMAFGGIFEVMEAGEDREGIWDIILGGNKQAALVSHLPWAASVFQKIPAFSSDLQRMRKLGLTTARLKKGSKVKDLWYHLADDANIEKVRPTFGSVVADGSLTVVAGSDTSATVMTTFFYYMLLHPEYMKDVRAEVDAAYSLGGDIFDALKNPANVPFMTACLNETLRLQPPVPSGGTRRVVGERERLIAGQLVPPDTEIYVPGYSLHRDPRYFWPYPNGFWPMRWLLAAKDPNAVESTLPPGEHFIHNATAFIPFSSGPANCVAKNLAWQEMRTIVGMLVHEFDVEPSGPLDGWERRLLDHYVLSKAPLRVVLSTRTYVD